MTILNSSSNNIVRSFRANLIQYKMKFKVLKVLHTKKENKRKKKQEFNSLQIKNQIYFIKDILKYLSYNL